ncbi:hypothetical protein Tco_1312679 [Tanacetum coccineum]
MLEFKDDKSYCSVVSRCGNCGGQNRDGNVNPGQAKPIMCYNCKRNRAIARSMSTTKASSGFRLLQRKCAADEMLMKMVMYWGSTTQTCPGKSFHLKIQSTMKPGHHMLEILVLRYKNHDTFVGYMDVYLWKSEMQSDVKHNSCLDLMLTIRGTNRLDLVPNPLSALTVYPPNTHVSLSPGVLPTKSKVKINLFVFTLLLYGIDQNLQKRNHPTGVIETGKSSTSTNNNRNMECTRKLSRSNCPGDSTLQVNPVEGELVAHATSGMLRLAEPNQVNSNHRIISGKWTRITLLIKYRGNPFRPVSPENS